MNGYLRIKNTDLYERDGVTYWRNGGNIIGNVVKAVIEENDVITSETYYIESLKTAKAIMLDPGVKIGGLTASESKNGNFIIVVTEPADFTEYGGGAGLKITFIYGVNYYSIETVESNGDIKIYDPDGDAGTLIPDALPDTTDAAAGYALVLDEDKKPVWSPSGGGGGGGTLYKRYITCTGRFNAAHSFEVTFLTYSLTNTETLTDFSLFPDPIVFESSPDDPNEDDPIMLWTDGFGSVSFDGGSYVTFINIRELSASYTNSFNANVSQYFERI